MDSPAAIVAVIILAIVLVGGGAMAQLALEENGVQRTYTEDFNTTTPGSTVTFTHSLEPGVYYTDTVNVTDENGTRMREGYDYDWNTENGTLTVLNGPLENDTGATITYAYRDPTQSQTQTAQRLSFIYENAYALPLVGIIALVLLAISGLSSLT